MSLALERAVLGLAFFVTPLLFFTDLTRNPYFTQITLLNALLLAWPALYALRCARQGAWAWPRTALDAPWAAWLAVCVASLVWSYARHPAFFSPSILREGGKVLLFNVVNVYLAFLAGALLSRPEEKDEPEGWGWLGLALGFALPWLLFQQLRSAVPPLAPVWDRFWDPYGGLVWLGGASAAALYARKGGLSRHFHLLLAVACLAAGYGVLQYFNIELVWSKVLNPYGGRAVSTFGNPNFLSTFVVLLFPGVLWLFLRSDGARRWVYGAVSVLMAASLLASLTRSSWLGAAAASGLLALSPEVRGLLWSRRRAAAVLLAAHVALLVVWPRSPVEGYQVTAVGRVIETAKEMASGETYAPWHQRVLMWTASWQMGAEAPILGKGQGLIELFYPFYQGPLMLEIPRFRTLRTHANNSHNEILEVFSQTGLAGLGVWVWLWVVFFRGAWDARPRRGRAWAWPLAAGAAGVLVDNMLNVSMHFAVPAMALYWAVGAATGAAGAQEPRPRVLPRAAAYALAALIVAGAAAGSWYWYTQWRREAHYFQGFKLMRQGPSAQEAALRELRRSFDWHPGEVNAVYELANALARVERYEEAVEMYRAALRANAGYDEIYFNLGTVLGAKLGRWKEAEVQYRTAVWINPFSRDAWSGLASILINDLPARKAEAVAVLERALAALPEDAAFANNLGYVHATTGDSKAAAAAYERALRAEPGFELAERNLRSVLPPGGRSDVLEDLQALRELEGRVAAGRVDDASLRLAQRAAEGFPRDARARYYLGTILLAKGRPQEAEAELRRSIAAKSDNPLARLNLGLALEAQGRGEEAKAEFREVLRKDPANAVARARLAASGGNN